MAGAVRETVTLAGRAERARLARAFVEGVLGPGHPCGDVAALLVGELFSNSLRHSGSGAPGETVTVAVKTANDVIRVEVAPGGQCACEVVTRGDIRLHVLLKPRRRGLRRDRAEPRRRQRTVRDNQPRITPAKGLGLVSNRTEQP
jgi:hypothetical protein